MTSLESPFATLLNRLLERETWARGRLAPFAGETLCFRAPPLPSLAFEILPDGRLAPGGAEAGLTIALGPDSLAALAQGEDHFLRSVQVTGNARLAAEVMLLARHLRWDAEEDLSRVIGDAAAHRVAGLARSFLSWHVDALRRLGAGAAEYVVEEARMLVTRAELEAMAEQTARLRDGLERLDARLRRGA